MNVLFTWKIGNLPHSLWSVVCFDFSDRELAHGNEGKTHRNERNGFTSSK